MFFASFFFSKISIWVQTPFLKTVREINVTVDNMVWFLWGGLSWEQKTLRARFKPNNRSTFKGKNSSLFTLVFYFMSLRNGNKFAFSLFFLSFFFSSFFLCLAFFLLAVLKIVSNSSLPGNKKCSIAATHFIVWLLSKAAILPFTWLDQQKRSGDRVMLGT